MQELISVLKKLGFWIWHDCKCKGYAEFQIFLIMTPYGSMMPEYTLMSPNTSEKGWILMNVTK